MRSTLLLALPLTVGCVSVQIWDGSDITRDTQWGGVVLVESGFDITARLVLEPCTRIELGPNVLINVADGGSIVAIGEEDCPIVFTSSQPTPAPGDWQRLDLWASSANDTAFEHVRFEYGGSDRYGAVWMQSGATASYSDVEVVGTTDVGLHFEADARLVDFRGMRFSDIGGHLAQMGMEAAGVADDVTALDNVQSPRLLVVYTNMDEDVTFTPLSVPYELDDQDVSGTWTVEPGTTVQFAPDALIQVQDGGTIVADGTPDAPVVFESAKSSPAAGDWARFNLWASSSNGNAFRHAVVRHGGSNARYGALWVQSGASVELDTVTFESNGVCDVAAEVDSVLSATGTPFAGC